MIQKDFLWGCRVLECKSHLVNWEIICFDKNKGGLNFKSLSFTNKGGMLIECGGMGRRMVCSLSSLVMTYWMSGGRALCLSR